MVHRAFLGIWMVVLSTATGCGASLDGITVQSADLANWSEFSLAVLLGGDIIGADLVVTEPDATQHVFPASIIGVSGGLVFDMSVVGDDVIDCGDVRLALPATTVPGNDLLGTYGGSGVAVGVGVGLTQHELENGAGVRLESGNFGIVVAMEVGLEALTLSVGDGQ